MKKIEVHWGQVDVAKFLKSEIIRFWEISKNSPVTLPREEDRYLNYAEAYENLYGILFDKEENKL